MGDRPRWAKSRLAGPSLAWASSQCAWRDYGGSVPSPRKTWGSPGIWTHWEVRPLLCKATSRARSQCHPISGGAYESRNEEKGDPGTASRVGWNWSSDKDLSPQLPFPPAAFPTSHTLSSSARFWHSDAQLRGGLAKMSLTPRLLRRKKLRTSLCLFGRSNEVESQIQKNLQVAGEWRRNEGWKGMKHWNS